jgi:uncharacterized protein
MTRTSTAGLFSILSTVALAAAPVPAFSQAVAADTGRAEIVNGATGEAQLVPDRATIYIGVQTRAASAAAAARDNAQRQRSVIDAIAALGVARDQISTENYSVAPETRFEQNTQRTTVTGYVVSNVVRVEVRRLEQLPSIIDAAIGKGANQVNSLDFFSSSSDSARHVAMAQAISRARADAEVMARAAGGSLGSLIELSTSDAGPRPVFRMAPTLATMATPIEPGQQRVAVSVTARWRFIRGR